MIFEKIKVAIYNFFKHSHNSGYSEAISNGSRPYTIITSFELNNGFNILKNTRHIKHKNTRIKINLFIFLIYLPPFFLLIFLFLILIWNLVHYEIF